jgi:DNA-binding MarR family transcriptional regulator
MSKKLEFIEFIEKVMNDANIGPDHMPENVRLYWEAFRGANEDGERPIFTENGKLILKYLQDNQNTTMWKARDIAEGMFINSRTVSGAMRKLVTDGFVEKIGENPVIYSITEKGKNIEIN